jgi:DNA-binding response OmpR family regulator
VKENKSPQALEPTGASLPGQRRPAHRVLVADDETAVRQMITSLLVRAGYDVDAAEDGAGAWDALQANHYDLMITDNQMPKLTGFEVVRKLRAAGMALPVVMVTGTLPVEEMAGDPSLHIAATLLKPFAIATLLGTVKNILPPSQQGDELDQPASIFDQMAQALAHYETEHQPADHALKASEVRYRRLFETARTGY